MNVWWLRTEQLNFFFFIIIRAKRLANHCTKCRNNRNNINKRIPCNNNKNNNTFIHYTVITKLLKVILDFFMLIKDKTLELSIKIDSADPNICICV